MQSSQPIKAPRTTHQGLVSNITNLPENRQSTDNRRFITNEVKAKVELHTELLSVYRNLLECYGPQHWWPANSPFEVMVGAILTQNTAWTNVEKAISNLKAVDCLDPTRIAGMPTLDLGQLIKPSGYFNVKAKRLQALCIWYQENGGYRKLSQLDTVQLRQALLSVYGIGPETADDILLYAFERPVFVIDTYTRRLFSRLELFQKDLPYETMRTEFETALPANSRLFSEYHALIVSHGKDICRNRPRCDGCCIRDICSYYG